MGVITLVCQGYLPLSRQWLNKLVMAFNTRLLVVRSISFEIRSSATLLPNFSPLRVFSVSSIEMGSLSISCVSCDISPMSVVLGDTLFIIG